MTSTCTTIIKYYSYDHNPYLKTKSPLEEMPIDVALLILRKLTAIDLLRCSESTKGLRQLTSHNRLWKTIADLIELTFKKIDFLPDPMICMQAVVRAKVEKRRRLIQKKEPSFVWTSENSEVPRARTTPQELSDMLNLRCEYELLLKRIRGCSLEVIEGYTTILQEKYPNRYSMDFPQFIIETHPVVRVEVVLKGLITQCLEKGYFNTALDYLAEMVDCDGFGNYSFDCIYDILSCANKSGNLSVGFEMLSRGLVPQNHRVHVIVIMIKELVDILEMVKADAMLKHFEADLDGHFVLGSRTRDLINIYVELGYNQKAWDIAEDNYGCVGEYTVCKALVMAFYKKGLIEEFKKAVLASGKAYKNQTSKQKEEAIGID